MYASYVICVKRLVTNTTGIAAVKRIGFGSLNIFVQTAQQYCVEGKTEVMFIIDVIITITITIATIILLNSQFV